MGPHRSRHSHVLLHGLATRRVGIVFCIIVSSALQSLAQTNQTVVGGGPNNMPATSANLNQPAAVAVNGSGNLYIADHNNSRVYRVDSFGQLTVFAGARAADFGGDGGPAASACLNDPPGCCRGLLRKHVHR